ncbi:MAG TPA: HTH domain-containing protein [Nitrospiraceae bacterium]|nr:HTH domain-containing protein [Nitrospiraceae bacterium]
MTQQERDRLVTLKKAKKGLITQQEAAEELQVSVRHIRRMIERLRQVGDKSVIHGLKGQVSNRRIAEADKEKGIEILSADVYEGFGPTLAAEYLRKKHGITASKETVRRWMMGARLWRGKKAKLERVHVWRPRRSQFGELVQWDTSDHDWLEGRGERLYLIALLSKLASRETA